MRFPVKLGFTAGYWSAGPPAGIEASIAAAEDLGYDSFWTAEAYGSDALTPLAWWGAKTKCIKLGTSIAQISARTPAAMAMAAMTLDHLSGGRFILGLGASGPQVVEGWYGQPYTRPLGRTREYVEIIRKIVARDEPVSHAGNQYQVPYFGGAGLGKPLKSILHPYRTDLPIYLGADARGDGAGDKDARPSLLRALRPRPRRIRPAGRRRLVRAAVHAPARAHAGVRRDHPQDRRAR